MDITFPVTADDFIAYQEAGIHRKLRDLERKLATTCVSLINTSYQDGLNGQENHITLEIVREFHRGRGDDPDKCIRIWESICRWCDKAYHAGREAAQGS